MLPDPALPAPPRRQEGAVLRAAGRVSSHHEFKSSRKFPLFLAFVSSYVPDAKRRWAQSRLCARRRFSRLSERDWGPQLTRGGRHLPQTGAMTLVVAGSRWPGGPAARDASQKQSRCSSEPLVMWNQEKKNCPAATKHPPCLRRGGGLTLQLFVGE